MAKFQKVLLTVGFISSTISLGLTYFERKVDVFDFLPSILFLFCLILETKMEKKEKKVLTEFDKSKKMV